jgi:hypothetical protein
MQRGDRAPDFELPDEAGHPRRLSEMLRAGPVVLFFYPRAMTSGCTAEACHFRDLRAEFEKVGAQRIGISVDPVSKQKQFSAKHRPDGGGHKTRLGKRASNPLAPSTRPGGLPIADASVVITSDARTTKRSQLRPQLQASSFESPQLAELLSLPYLHGWSGSGIPTTEQMRALQRTVHSDDRTTNGRSPPAVKPCSGVTAMRPQTPRCGPRLPTPTPGR